MLRGADETSGHLFSDVDLEGRVPALHRLRAMRAMRGLVKPTLAGLDGAFSRSLCAAWPTTHRARAAFAGDPAAAIGFDPVGTAGGGTVGVRSLVPVVRRTWRGRCGLGCLEVCQEPLLGADDSARARFPVGLAGAARGEEALERATFFARPDDAEGGRVDAELPGEGRFGRAAGTGVPRRARLQSGGAFERDPCRDDGPGCAAPSQGQGPGPGPGSGQGSGQGSGPGPGKSARRSRPWVAGEPQRSGPR